MTDNSELSEYISEHSNDFKIITEKRNVDAEMINNALDIIHKYIINKQLILYGGLAIDYALRIKGEHIYNEETIPDFVVLSPDSVNNAYEIADILYKAGFEAVNAITAAHIQTMRIRINFIYVLDISYVPVDVFNNLPFLMYKGMKIINPNFQRMDQHLSLSFPFNGVPHEQLFNRWEKDFKRFALLDKYYPIAGLGRQPLVITDSTNDSTNNTSGGWPRPASRPAYDLKNLRIFNSKEQKSKLAFHGFAA